MREGWREVRLGEVCDFYRGLTYSKKDEVDSSANVVLRANNIDLDSGALVFDSLRFISDAVQIPEAKRLRRDSLLICTASGSKKHLGKVALVDSDYGYAFGGFMGMLVPNDGLDPKYLYRAMTSPSYGEFIDRLSDGVNINNLKFTELSEFAFPLPPLPEQKRIVAILDEAFAGIDRAIANTEKNVANARELFESYLNSVFSRKGEGWVEVGLSEVCNLVNGRAFKKSELLAEGKYPVLRVGNFFSNPHWYFSDLELDDSKYCDAGDLLYAWSASFGPRIWNDGKVIFHYHIWRVDLDPKRLSKGFAYYWFRWDAERIKAEMGAGTTMIHVSKKSMESRAIAAPSLTEQQGISLRLERIELEAMRLEETLHAKLAALSTLKQSLLQKAFSGELTAKEADRTMALA